MLLSYKTFSDRSINDYKLRDLLTSTGSVLVKVKKDKKIT